MSAGVSGAEHEQGRRHATTALVALAGAFALAALVDSPLGPLFLLPPLLAGYWFGRVGGALAGVAATLLFVVARAVDVEQQVPPPESVTLRLLVFSLAGFVVGVLAEQRGALNSRVHHQRRELDDLRVIREVLTPARVKAPDWLDLAACFVPASHGVAGDFYLAVEACAGTELVAIGDAAGKGVEAARRASFVRASLASFAPMTNDPARLLELANYSLIERGGTSHEFVTAACAVIAPDGQLEWAIAGHPPPMLLDDGAPLEGATTGLPLGMEIDIGSTAARATLAQGGGLLLYSDGLVDARTRERGQFGAARVQAALARLEGGSPADVVHGLHAEAVAFAGDHLDDDLSMAAVRFHARGSRSALSLTTMSSCAR